MAEEETSLEIEEGHCDDFISDISQPECLRWFLLVNRLPAVDKWLVIEKSGGPPKLFARYQGEWYRAVMASRLGDIGLTKDLDAENGYSLRVKVSDLSDFTDKAPK